MHHAPAVRYPVGRSRFHLTLILLISFLSAFALVGWVAVQDDLTWRHGASWVVWCVTVSWAGWAWWRSPQGELAYGSDSWTWMQRGQIQAVSVRVELDLQHTLLLHVAPSSNRSLWVWLERMSAPMQWQAVRRAVFAPTPKPAVDLGDRSVA